MHGFEHAVIASEQQFVLLICQNATVSITHSYSCQSEDPEVQRRSLVHMAHFLSHAMCKRLNGPCIEQRDTIGLIRSGIVCTQCISILICSFTWMYSALDHVKSHHCWRLQYIACPSKLMLRTQSNTVTFTLQSIASPWILQEPSGYLEFHKIISNGMTVLYRGSYGKFPVVGKVDGHDGNSVATELKAYLMLQSLQHQGVPLCYGLFRIVGIGQLLLLSDCGATLDCFQQLTPRQRYILRFWSFHWDYWFIL